MISSAERKKILEFLRVGCLQLVQWVKPNRFMDSKLDDIRQLRRAETSDKLEVDFLSSFRTSSGRNLVEVQIYCPVVQWSPNAGSE